MSGITITQEEFKALMGNIASLQTSLEKLTRQYDPEIRKTLLTTEETALYLGFRTGSAFRRQRRENPGRFPDPIRVGGVLRYRVHDLDDWIKAQPSVPADE